MRVPKAVRLSRHLCAAPLFVLALFAVIANRGDRVAAQEPPPAAMRWDGLIEQISAPPPFSWNYPQPAAPSQLPRHSVSADGRFVMFAASYQDGSGQGIFLHDRDSGDNNLVLGAWATHPALSADGHHLAFEECGWNREPGPPYYCDVVVLDLRTGAIHRVSETADGIPGDGDSSHPVLSADGRFVAFRTKATNLAGPGAVSGQIVVRDRDADGNGIFDEPGSTTIDLVSAQSGSSAAADAESDSAELSDDGRYVAFRSRATNLRIAESTAEWNVFLRDRLAHETRQLNVRPDGQPSPFSVDAADISITADGRSVAFASADPMLAAGYPDDADAALDVFVYDRDAAWLTRIDLTSDGLGGSADVRSPMFSADGRYVAVVAMSRNNSYPPAPFSNLVHVYDRATATSTLVSVRPDGVAPDDRADQTVLSADGSTVLFVSAATNLAPNVTARLDNVYAAVHFAVEPSEVTVPARGGTGTYTITAQAHTHWIISAAEWPNWFTVETAPQGIGDGTLVASAWQPNYDQTSRSTTLTVNSVKTLRLTQEPGLWLTSVSPGSGPATGGTIVTLHGTSFEPDTRVLFSNTDATNVQFVDSTTMIATAPPGSVGPAFVGVVSSDFRTSWLGEAFRYLDTTPPTVFPGLSGIIGGDGWFTSDVDLYWGAWDPDTPVTSWSGCDPTRVTTDTPGTTFTCTATSEGGTASASATVKRDATPPAITITSPSPSQPIYERNQIAAAAYQCADALSGVASCSGDAQPGEPIDTSSPGYHSFTAWGGDRAGNFGGVWTEYAVSNGFCTAANPGLKAWWRMAGDTREAITGATPLRVDIAQDAFAPAIAGDGYVFPHRSTGRLDHDHDSALDFTTAMTFAGWVKPTSAGWGVLVRHPFQYTVERFGDGSIGFQFAQQDGGVAQATTAARAPQDVWTHVAVTYDVGFVKTYINGRLVDTYRRTGTLRVPAWQTPLSIGGQDDPGNPKPFVGSLDELQLFDRVLSDGDIESLFLAGSDGTCEPRGTAIELSPIHTTYGAGTYHVTATLRDDSGQPLPDESVTLYQEAYDEAGDPMPTVTLTTDGNGLVTWDAPFAVGAGTYSNALRAVFAGTASYAHSSARADVVVEKAAIQINWPAPSPIVYGTPLGAAQLNASASVAGSFAYSPGFNTVLAAGSGRALSATFTPSDTRNYTTAAAAAMIDVARAPLTVRTLDAAKPFGAALPPFTASGSGFVNGDSMASLSGTVTFTTPATAASPVGTYAVTPSGVTSGNYAIAFAAGTLTISPATTSVAVMSSASPSGFNQAVTFSASVAVVAGAGNPTGTIEFRDGSTRLGTVTLASGSAALSTNGLSAGSHSISVLYSGDPSFAGGTQSIVQVVDSSAASSSTTVTSSSNPAATGAALTLTATVMAPAGTTGNVAFYDGATLLGTVPLSGTTARFSTTTLAGGAHGITARYLGNGAVPPSISPMFVQDVAPAGTRLKTSSVALAASPSPATLGGPVTFTANVSGANKLLPTGAILFTVNGQVIGNATGITLTATGSNTARATLTTSALAHGTHTVTATYLGDTNYRGAASTISVTVN